MDGRPTENLRLGWLAIAAAEPLLYQRMETVDHMFSNTADGGSVAGIGNRSRPCSPAICAVGSLNAAQSAVNVDCSGQGADMIPNGPLPSGYSPAS